MATLLEPGQFESGNLWGNWGPANRLCNLVERSDIISAGSVFGEHKNLAVCVWQSEHGVCVLFSYFGENAANRTQAGDKAKTRENKTYLLAAFGAFGGGQHAQSERGGSRRSREPTHGRRASAMAAAALRRARGGCPADAGSEHGCERSEEDPLNDRAGSGPAHTGRC